MKRKMKILTTIAALALSLPILAQRDFQLVVDRNVWLNSGNAAAYTTFSDTTITRATVDFNYNNHGYTPDNGRSNTSFGISAESYMRLAGNVMAYGRAAYSNNSISEAGGSTILGLETLQPFDIVESPMTYDGEHTTLGNKKLQMYQFTGILGCNITKGLSLGALFDFNAGSYVKEKDLRHTNSLMKLDARFSLMQQFSKAVAAGASFIYKRNTETIQYEAFGTTDRTYSVLVDYANGTGIIETFGENKYTDEKHELPLVNNNAGGNIQIWLKPFRNNAELLVDFTFLHRYGFYGQEAQFTASQANHKGNIGAWKAVLTLPSATNSHLTRLEGNIAFHELTSYSTNYRKTRDASNNNVESYEYFTPTKTSDRYLMTSNISCTSYFGIWQSGCDCPAIYPWKIQGGVSFSRSKQTAYLGLDMNTHDVNVWAPFLSAKHNMRMRKTDVLGMEIAAIWQLPSSSDFLRRGITIAPRLSYEFPIPQFPTVRPVIALSYQYSDITYRNSIIASVGVNF